MEYEIQGGIVQRRSLANMLDLYEQMMALAENQRDIEQASSFFNELLLNGGEVPKERRQEELEQLIAYKSEKPIINAYKNKILKDKFSQDEVMRAKMKKMYEASSAQDRSELQYGVGEELQNGNDVIQSARNIGEGLGLNG